MDRFTVAPFLVVFFAGLLELPALNVFKICAWNAGTMKVDPWRIRAGAAVQKVSQALRSWFASLFTRRRVAFACLAVLIAILAMQLSQAHPTAHGLHVLTATVTALPRKTVKELEAKRARLMREAGGLKRADGTFADDTARASFDEKMAKIEEIDRTLSPQSETLVERNPLDPGAPTGGTRAEGDDEGEGDDEPNELDATREAERARCQGVLNACRAARLPQSFADKLIAEGVALVDAQSRIFSEMAKRDGNGPRAGAGPQHQVIVGDDPLIHQRSGIENALLHRSNPHAFKLDDNGRQYRGMTLLDVARVFIQARGIRTTNMSKMELAAAALGLDTRGALHTASDFANLLADVANKSLRNSYEQAPQTFAPITRVTTIPDFKLAKRLQIGEAPSLLAIDDQGEFTRGTIGEGKEQYQLATYGRIFGISRKALINDDTDAFSRVPMLFGRAAKNLESNLVWSQVLSNPTMGDGTALFHANHSNLSGTSDAISVASIGAGRAAMRKQFGVDGSTLINVVPAWLIVPPAKETLADQFVSTNLLASQSSSVNPFAGRLQVISEPRLEVGIGAVSGSNVAWYLAANPDQIDVLEIAYLEGENGPVVESRLGFDVDGLEIKCRHDVAAKVIDYRGLYKNPGA
jgi:hypothetical protein